MLGNRISSVGVLFEGSFYRFPLGDEFSDPENGKYASRVPNNFFG